MSSTLELRNLTVSYRTVSYRDVIAVNQVNLIIEAGKTVGLVGESGSGKSSLARAVVGMIPPSGGEILLDGVALTTARTRSQRKTIQMVHQDPYSSLNPRMTVRQMLAEPLRFHRIVPRSDVNTRCNELMAMVRLDPESLDRYPAEFSGGQRQRIAIARALSVEPSVLVADEPTSALDVSVQATVLELLTSIQHELGLTMLFISHDLGVINTVCDAVAAMRTAQIVEFAQRAEFFANPTHPYSRELLDAVPRLSVEPFADTKGGAADDRSDRTS